ncbi:hypothetical protein TNCV_1417231 [Trichonephila clavipes]|nr:hypothetical protein TNCV_1417231 [Trichonephila clavipes]
MHNGRTPLHNFDGESVTSQRHYREMILDHVRIFRVTVDSDFLFMDDNEHPHRSVEVSATLQSENILRTQWHVSPDQHLLNMPGMLLEDVFHKESFFFPVHFKSSKPPLERCWDNISKNSSIV